MNYKEQLVKVIDATVSGDEQAQKDAFSAYIQDKSKELLGVSTVNEVWLDKERGIELVGADDVIILQGKRIGRIVYKNDAGEEIPPSERGEPENATAMAYFKGDDGHSYTLDTMDPAEIVRYVAQKYLGEKQ